MSKIGNKPISIPQAVKVSLEKLSGGDQKIIISGPKGTLCQTIKPGIIITLDEKKISLKAKNPEKKALQGLYRSLLANMIIGVTSGWNKGLELKGVGFKALVSGDKLILNIGFSHPVEFPIPQGIQISVSEGKINVSGIDKQLVGETAARIRKLKPPEPYKGKGIRYIGEIVRKKAGKQAVKAGAA